MVFMGFPWLSLTQIIGTIGTRKRRLIKDLLNTQGIRIRDLEDAFHGVEVAHGIHVLGCHKKLSSSRIDDIHR